MLSRGQRLLDWFLPSDLQQAPDPSTPDRGRALVAILLFAMIQSVAFTLSAVMQIGREESLVPPLGLGASVLLVIIICFWLIRQFAAIQAAAYLFASCMTTAITLLLYRTDTFIGSPFVLHLLLQPFLLFVVAGRRAALFWALLVIAIGGWLGRDHWTTPAIDDEILLVSVFRISSWPVVILALLSCFWYLDYFNRKLTRRVAQERDLAQYAAGHDPLTELLNRGAFEQRLENSVRRALLNDVSTTLLLIDLDGFKIINDSCGHQTGDRLLQALASRMQKTVRQYDTVARLGGDEFAILMEGAATREVVERITSQLVAALSAPVTCGGKSIGVSASVGVALCPEDATSPEQLIRYADAALYTAKAQGKNRTVFFKLDPAHQ